MLPGFLDLSRVPFDLLPGFLRALAVAAHPVEHQQTARLLQPVFVQAQLLGLRQSAALSPGGDIAKQQRHIRVLHRRHLGAGLAHILADTQNRFHGILLSPRKNTPPLLGKEGALFGGILSKNIISILSRRVKIYIFPEMVVIFRHSSGIISVLWPCAMIPPFFTALSSSLRGRREARPMGLCPYPCEKFHTGGDPHGCMRPDL